MAQTYMEVYRREVRNRKCENCRICNYMTNMRRIDPDSDGNPVNFVFDMNDIVKMCHYCMHVCCYVEDLPGQKIYNPYVKMCLCEECKICMYARNPDLMNNAHQDPTVVGDVLRICRKCFHVGCGNFEDNYCSPSTSSSDASIRFHTRSDDSGLSLYPYTSTNSTSDSKSDDTQHDINIISDPSAYLAFQMWLNEESLSEKLTPESSSKESSVEASDVAAGGLQEGSARTRLTDEALSGSQVSQAQLTEENTTTDEAPGGSRKFSTRTPQPKITEEPDESSNDK